MPRHASRTVMIATILAAVAGATWAGVNVWTPVGPSGAANIGAVAVDLSAPNTLYLGFASDRRVWKTTDGGTHWLQMGSGMPTAAGNVIGLAVSPVDSTVVFAAVSTRQVYRSTDGGSTWGLSGGSSMPTGTASNSASFAFQPGVPSTVYASFGSTTGSLFKSTDGGLTWERHDPLWNVGVTRLVGTASSPPALYAAVGLRGIFKSTDGAATWNPASNGLPFAVSGGQNRYNVSTIAADPANPDVLYAVSNRDRKVYKTINGATDWSPVSTDANSFGTIFVQPGTGYVYAIGIDWLGASPTNRNCIFRSTDSGVIFSIFSGAHQSTSNVAAFHPTDPSTVYAGLDEGLYKTADGGTTWSPAYGTMRNLDAQEIAFAPSLPSTYWVGYWITMGKTTDSGATFTLMNPSVSYPYGERFAIHPTDPDTVLTDAYNGCYNRPDGVACTDSSMIKSTNGGTSWSQVANPLYPDDWGLGQVWGLAYDPADASIVYAAAPVEASPSIYKSTDGGSTFGKAGGTGDPDYTFWPNSAAFVVAPTTPTTIYIGTASNYGGRAGVWRSTDQAASWQLKNNGLPATLTQVRALAVHPTNPAVLFAGVRTQNMTGQGIYKTIDAGDTWTLLADSGTANILSLAVDPAAPDTLYASVSGGGYGIYRSTDGGLNWQPFYNGLDSLLAWKIVVDPANHNHLLAGTRAGVYEITIDTSAGDSDFDGIPDAVENGAPNGGDGNRDGIPDSQQPYVASLHSGPGPYATFAVNEQDPIGGVAAVPNPSPSDAPPGAAFPYGFFRFSVYGVGVSGGAATVTLTVPPNPGIVTYYRYGPTPDNATPHWYNFAYDGKTGAEVFQDGGQTRIVLHFVDGARGDDDLQGNGTIRDAGAPAALPIPATERAALIAFYTSTNGDSWRNKTGWKTPPLAGDGFAMPNTECTWRGITCNASANVVSLNLNNNHLTGTWSDLSALTQLQTLNLGNNSTLTPAPVPSWVAGMTTLTTLNLNRTRRTGDIPDLSGLGSLNLLDLSSNSFNAGPIPAWVASRTSLVSLNLSATNRNGSIPDLSGLPVLAALNLGGNPNFTAAPIPAWIAGKTSLTSLNLSNTNRTGDILDLSALTNLTVLNLNTNLRMRGPVPSWLTGLTKLTALQLSNTRRTGAIPDLSALASLATLDLSNNWTLDLAPIPAWLDGMAALTWLNLQYTNRTGAIPDLHDLAKLAYLNLDYNPMLDPAPIPSWLAGITLLEELYLANTNRNGTIPDLSAITDLIAFDFSDNTGLDAAPIPTWLVNGPNLGEVYLGNTNRTGAIPDLHTSATLYWLDFANNPGLEAGALPAPATLPPNLNGLYLYNTNRTSIATDLSSLSQLQYLDLGGNPIPPGPVPSWILGDTNLLEVSLANAGLTGAFPDFSGLTSLDLLDLHGNPGLTAGGFPSWLSAMANLNYIYLGDTNRTGDLDDPTLAALNYPLVLDLSNSPTLTAGPIPRWVATKASLQVLSLASTNRTGDIPDLSALTSLSQLYLDENPGFTASDVPAWPASMPTLVFLHLTNTNRTGTIPAWPGASNLKGLWLGHNHLTGSIPPELGDSYVRYLQLQGNMLSGTIPSELANLIQLWTPIYDPNSSDLRWNALHTSDATLDAFLDSRQIGGDWSSTQTIAPSGVAAGTPLSTTVPLTWTPIPYQADSGGYRPSYSTSDGGPFTPGDTTGSKADTGTVVTGLTPGTPYFFFVQTVTNPHPNNPNTVVSEASAIVTATTGFDLTVVKPGTGAGAVSSSPAGILCGSTCGASFAVGTVVTLTARATAGSVFTGWSDEGCSGTGTCQVTMDQARSVTATFTKLKGSKFYALTPCRLVDTRSDGTGAYADNGGAGETRRYDFHASVPYTGTGACSLIPLAAALSLSIQFQVTDHNASLIAYPDDVTRPLVANVVAYNTGLFYLNSAFVPTGADNGIKVFAQYGGQVVININGYFK